MPNQTVVCFGPGPQFKGGISNYNTSLAKSLEKQGASTHIVSWTHQYPSIVPREFVDKTSKKDFLEGTSISCDYVTNYNNPFTWGETAQKIASYKPDVVVIQWSIAIQGLPLRHIVKKLKRISNCRVLFDLHFVVQKEKSTIDKMLTRYALKMADGFIVHALKTYDELTELFPSAPFYLNETGERENNTSKRQVIKLFHPIYDLFSPDENFDVQAFKNEIGLKKNVFLFFGFIRKYKGLHNAIKAFEKVQKERDDVSLLICGESFWKTVDQTKFINKLKSFVFNTLKKLLLNSSDNEQDYNPLALVDELELTDSIKVFNEFVANEDVHKYFQASDCAVLYYLTATPSGIESLSYNFKLPLLATKVGHFPETITDGFNGYLAEANDVDSMAKQMLRYLDKPLPSENVEKATKNLSWSNYASAILRSINEP